MVLTEASGNRRSESDSYFADDEDGELAESRMVRAAPRISDVEQATDPYSTNKRLWTTTLGLACLGAILCLLAVAIPSKPSVDLATVRELDVDGSEVPEELGRLQREGFEIANASDGQVPTYNWVFSAKDGNAVLSLQPARVSQGALSNLGEWRRLGDYEENEGSLGLIQEAEYLDSLGNRSYGWFQALQSSGEQLDLNSNNRLGRTLLAKLSADGQPKPIYEVRLFLESGRILSRGRRDEYRQTFDQLMKQVQKVLQNQNGGNN